jgi:20S proteasome alpha/beta subunit
VSLLEFNDFTNFECTCQNIYVSLSEPPVLTVIIGAKCSDGVVMVADKKLTDIFGRIPPEFTNKISGDLRHVLMGYTGLREIFDIFRKAIVGDWLLTLNTEPYTFDNYITRCCPMIRALNGIARGPNYHIQLLIGKHQLRNTQLYYIDDKGKENKISDYIAIGSGKGEADIICKDLEHNNITMKEFAKHAYFAIMDMNKYHPGLGVGVEPGGVPRVTYLHYDKETDEDATLNDIEEYKKYSDQKNEHSPT